MGIPVAWALVLSACVAGLVALAAVPRILIRRRQDALAAEATARPGAAWKLLTRADLVVSRYRRLPGLLGLTGDRLAFEGVFGESIELPTSRIRKIETGARLASGRLLFGLEVLRITRASGDRVEFVLTRPAASAWRSHLGLWAMAEHQADADRVSPGN